MNIKRLVLGTAAGALAVTGVSSAQAADLPVVVDPVDYVRICDAYGRGYYFIPGTETCLRIAGRVRADYNVFFDFEDTLSRPATYSPAYNLPPINFYDGDLTGPFGVENANDVGYRFRARGYIYMESRTATEFGLLRTFTEVQFTRDNAGGTGVNLDSAVIQFGGLIFGRTDSLYDFGDADIGSAQFFSYMHSDTKTNLIGYQAAFGNGFSAAISLEDNATRQVGIAQFVNTAANTTTAFNRQANEQIPDIVGNIRVDQGWGSAQLMAAGHYVEAVGITFPGGAPRGDGHEDEYGFAIGAGVAFNIPFGSGTEAALTASYGKGALSYVAAGASGPGAADAIIDNNGNLELGDFYSVSGGFSTSFTPSVSFAFQAGYAYMDHSEVQVDVGGFRGLESLDTSNVYLDGFLGYSPVSGMLFGVGAQYLYVDSDAFGEQSALSTFFRAQRTF